MSASSFPDDRQAAAGEVGPTLRSAREAAGYSIADIAEQMCLSPDNIEDIEAERFDRFPIAVFLRGYLTNYARLLGLDPEPLLEAYDRQGFAPPRLHATNTVQEKARGSELTVTVTTLVVLVVLVVLAVLWWREQWGENGETTTPDPVAERSAAPEPAGGGTPDLAGNGDRPGPPDSEAVGAPTLAARESAPADDGAAPTDGPASGEAGSAPARSDSEEILPEPPAPEAVSEPSAPEASAPEPPSGPAEQAEAPPAPDPAAVADTAAGSAAPSSIVIRVRDDCWLMVRDGNDQLIYRDLATAGQVLDLSGAPPIHIVAGYAKGIAVEYNGESFDLAPFIEQDTGTARFRLGA